MILAVLAILGGLLNFPFFSEPDYKAASEAHDFGIFLALEHWLEHSIESFHLTEEGIVDLPKTLTWVQFDVAAISTALAIAALLLALFLVYRNRWQTADERDPLERTPIWWMAVLPLDTLYMKGIIPAFNWLAGVLAYVIDWNFWHNFFHERVIRDTFVGFANFASDVLDRQGIDGLVNGAGQAARWLAGGLRLSQTGYARTYALSILLGTVALLAYFLWPIIGG
jgi:NADH-quinone oxidoreductase subunit L